MLAARGCLVIARDELLGVAYELALKLQELSYLPAIACHAGELKHGPLALIDHDLPTVVLIADNENGEKTMVAVQEILARRGPILVLAQLARPVEFVESETAHWLQLPTRSRGTSETAISFLTASHLLAYHAALHAGRPIDRPRHLAKSVTVV